VLKKDPGYLLKEIARSFKGKTREAIFCRRYDKVIRQSNSTEELISAEEELYPYVNRYVTSSETKHTLQKRYSDKYAYLISTMVGMPAPAFTLPDERNIIHNLSDYKGKVVYIDFWGSGCHPCRAETPFMKKICQQYLNDNRLQIISIDAFDTKKDWIQALKEDQPGWLQLRDEMGKLYGDYNTWSVPRFVIIDKKGKIVTLDAPRPSDPNKLMKILVLS
jgi:thiol-disulfide isomerase/thioredoxin